MMNAILSGVQCEAATKRSPSFSRSSSSVTTTISPLAKALIAASTRLWLSGTALTLKATLRARFERPSRPLADLTAVHQIVVSQHSCHHGLANRDRTNTNAGIVAALGDNIGVAAITVHRLARCQNRRRRFDREADNNRLPGRDTAENS